jgi:hypothetical protein
MPYLDLDNFSEDNLEPEDGYEYIDPYTPELYEVEWNIQRVQVYLDEVREQDPQLFEAAYSLLTHLDKVITSYQNNVKTIEDHHETLGNQPPANYKKWMITNLQAKCHGIFTQAYDHYPSLKKGTWGRELANIALIIASIIIPLVPVACVAIYKKITTGRFGLFAENSTKAALEKVETAINWLKAN